MPIVRQINGGTVFKVTYEPEELWDNSMRGAFEYACKIWEEQLPNSLPINSHPLKTIFQHKACTDKLYADSFYKVQKNSHSSFEVICCCS